MKIGLQFPSSTIGADPVAIRDFAQAAEGLGYNHLVVYEHILGTTPVARSPGQALHEADTQYHETLVLMGYLAAVTSTIELLTAVVVLPMRQAVVVAKQATEVDILSGGRLRLGVGVGRNYFEYQATGTDYHTRGKRIEEQIDLMRALWINDWVSFKGQWHEAENVSLSMPPVQRPIPVWMGGNSAPVLDRVGRLADGWITTSRTDGIEQQIATIKDAAKAAGRDPDAVGIEGRSEIAGKTPDEWHEAVTLWEGLGASYLNVRGSGGPAEELELARRFMKEIKA